MSASTHWLATASAQAVLERGGNAFDAAVAGGFVLHVVEPHLNGPGGDLVGIFATADDPGTPVVLMGQGPAPAGATIEHYRAEGLDLVPGAGALAAAVPGSVDAWLLLLHDHGTWEVADVLAYAIGYARDGHPLLAQAAATIGRVAGLFTEHWPTSAALWMPDGEVPEAGTIVRNPAYAAVLESLVAAGHAIRDDGPVGREERIEAARREWKTGAVARAAASFLAIAHRHSDGADHAGVITVGGLRRVRRRLRTRRLDRIPRPHHREGRCMDAGPRAAADAAHPRRLREHRPVHRSGRPHGARGAQARPRRPRRVLRRRRCAARAAAVGGVRGHATRPDRRLGVARMATRRGARTRAVPPRAAHRRCRRERRSGRAHPRRHVPHRRRGSLGQHDRGHPLRAAGCSPRRRSPSSASASAPGCR